MSEPGASREVATYEAILEAASRRYARFGPRKTTMDEIAREAGCSRATVYLHFPGKDALYAGLLERETRTFLEEVEVAVASSDNAPHKLLEILRATVRIYADRPVLGGALTGDAEMVLERVAAPAVRAHEKRVVALLRRVLAEGVDEGVFRPLDTAAVAYLMYQLGSLLVSREVSGRRDYALERILSVMSDLLDRGIEAKP